MTRLSPVLSAHDLPMAELCAARLDGELFRLDGCFCPIDEPQVSALRGAALAAVVPDRVIAEQRSAAWVWGAIDQPPTRHELCASSGARVRPPASLRVAVREVVIDELSIAEIGGMRVTTPLRTVVDLARFSTTFGDVERAMVLTLMMLGEFGVEACEADINGRRNLPNKKIAIARLRASVLP
jgi:hypothetical protein